MNNLKITSIATFLIIASNGFCQVPADSLPGTYAGKLYYASPPSNPWTITLDTFYVSTVDSVNCLIDAADKTYSYGGNYYTDYYSCNGAPPSNYFMKFYNNDSLKWIDDDVPQPPPNPHVSRRFYGRRISNHTSKIEEFFDSLQINIYPNPCNGILNIECKLLSEKMRILITDILGREIMNENLFVNKKACMDIGNLTEGIYFIRIETPTVILNKKLLIEK